MRNLVVFYSLEGNTRLIAESIAKAINADVLELKTKKKYSDKGFKKYFWGGKSVIFKEKPELLYLDKDINQYDNIFIGTPIWVGTYAPPLNTFLKNNKIEKKNIGLFACHGGGGATKFFNKFIGEIDFMEPLKNNKEEDVRKAIMWVKELIG